ncbi:MAG: two-component system cell cycle sensor histidine kinase/response regulator CckA, partial [Oceanicoccus sp.]
KTKTKTKTKNSDEPSPINCKKTGRILIVDDEESLVTLYDEYLSQEGYIVTVTAEPIKALSMFKKTPNQFDVVITDNNMPNMTGQQLAKEMLTIRPDLPIILSTGFMDTLMEHNIQNLGIRQCLLKPVRLKNLQDAIDTCLD